MRSLLSWLEKIFTLFVMVRSTGCLDQLLSTGPQAAAPELFYAAPIPTHPSNAVLAALQFVVLFGTVILVASRWQDMLRAVLKRKMLWAFLAFACISTLWSAAEKGDRTIMILLGATLFGIYLSVRYNAKELAQLLALFAGVVIAFNLLYIMAFPFAGIIGIGEHAGSWRGGYPQKNVFGQFMSLSILILFTTDVPRKFGGLKNLGILVATFLLIMSNSKTALVITLALLAMIPLLRAMRWRNPLATFGFMSFLLTLSIIAINIVDQKDAIFQAMGKDANLTGRTTIWSVVLDKFGTKPWFGYGMDGFWLGLDGDSADVWYATAGFAAPHAHNGFLDILIQFGIFGATLIGLSWLVGYTRALTWLRLGDRTTAYLPVLILTFILLANVTETAFTGDPRSTFWLLYVTITTAILIHPLHPEPSTPAIAIPQPQTLKPTSKSSPPRRYAN